MIADDEFQIALFYSTSCGIRAQSIGTYGTPSQAAIKKANKAVVNWPKRR
jgi:hypothetical protein